MQIFVSIVAFSLVGLVFQVEGFCPQPSLSVVVNSPPSTTTYYSLKTPHLFWSSSKDDQDHYEEVVPHPPPPSSSFIIQEEVSRRVALVMAAATVAAGGSIPEAEALNLASEVEALEYENIATVNTVGAPEKHLPKTTVIKGAVEVVVPHVMDPEKPHWIQYVWLKDESNNKVVEAKKFEATDPSPPTLTAKVKKGTKVKPLLFCNLHGLWQGETFTV